MSAATEDGPAPERGRMMRHRRSNAPHLDPHSARRQGEITQLAISVLGREAAIAFLNNDHAELGARPLDLAVASAHGRDRVEAVLGRLLPQPPAEARTRASHTAL